MTDEKKTELAVIGAGPGGYAAAFMAADLGVDVTLIDVEENPGGVCLYRGCIPSKVLLHAAGVISEARGAEQFGIKFDEPEIDIRKLSGHTQSVVQQLTGGLGQLSKSRKIGYLQGRASFIDSNTLAVFHGDATEINVTADHIIIAAGSRPARFGPLIDSPRMMDSTDALRLDDVPDKLLVVGGGYIGLELGTVYATLGSKVTVVEMLDGLLPGADRDLVKPLENRLEGLFEDILLKTGVEDMKEQKNGMKVSLKGEGLENPVRIFDKVLISVGRTPNASGLALKNTQVEIDDRGFVRVDEQCRTAEPHIFAIGDVVGGAMLAHKATHEGRTAAEVIAGRNAAFEPMAIPAVIFTDPEIAWCGMTENQAKESGRNIEVGRFPWAASGRALTLNHTEGVTKIICDAETKQILGAGMCGHGAGELIAEAALAIEMGALAGDLDMTIHPHPTLSETLMEAAAAISGTCTHMHRPKKKK
jgi:dihydrolipoamide dehydrogenase